MNKKLGLESDSCNGSDNQASSKYQYPCVDQCTMRDSVEYKSFINCIEILIAAVRISPMSVADTLVAKEFIPPEVYTKVKSLSSDYDKARELIDVVAAKIKLAPGQFDEFVALLAQKSFLEEARERLTAEYESE